MHREKNYVSSWLTISRSAYKKNPAKAGALRDIGIFKSKLSSASYPHL